MKRFLVVTAMLISATAFALDTGSVAQATSAKGVVTKTTLTWTAGTNDVVVGVLSNYLRGEVKRVEFAQAMVTGAIYNATLKDEAGVDILAGLGSGLLSNTVSTIVPGVRCTASGAVGAATNIVPFVINDRCTLTVTNCGNSSSGQVILYIQ